MEGDTLLTNSVTFTWNIDETSSYSSFNFYLKQDSEYKVITSVIKDRTLTLDIDWSGAYQWYVEAIFPDGKSTSETYNFLLVHPDDLPKMGSCSLVSKTKGEAFISSQLTETNGIISKGYVWSRYPNPDISDRSVVIDGDVLEGKISPLYDGIKFYVRAYAETKYGIVYSDQLSFTSWDDGEGDGVMTDARDFNQYPYVRIGGQKWMAKNLAYLPAVSEPQKGSMTDPLYYVYGYDGGDVTEAKSAANYQTYGVLYNWPAAIQDSDFKAHKVQGVCPDGWHLPNDEEWTILAEYLGGRDLVGGYLKERGFLHWQEPNTYATDDHGFTALPGGTRGVSEDQPFAALGTRAFFWSATEYDEAHAKRRYLYNEFRAMGDFYHQKDVGFSIRCVKD